jgi:hypothetical protein
MTINSCGSGFVVYNFNRRFAVAKTHAANFNDFDICLAIFDFGKQLLVYGFCTGGDTAGAQRYKNGVSCLAGFSGSKLFNV